MGRMKKGEGAPVPVEPTLAAVMAELRRVNERLAANQAATTALTERSAGAEPAVDKEAAAKYVDEKNPAINARLARAEAQERKRQQGELIDWTPTFTGSVTYQGVRYAFKEGVATKVHGAVLCILHDRDEALREADRHGKALGRVDDDTEFAPRGRSLPFEAVGR